MATKINAVINTSNEPVAYVGKSGMETGWSAWAFAPQSEHNFSWVIETTKGNQALLTKAGQFTIWDDGDWNIRVQHNGESETVLVHVNAALQIQINLSINENGYISASQI